MRNTLAKLIAFSIVQIAPSKFQTPYVVAIVDGEKGERILVKIKNEYFGLLRAGLEGEIKEESVDSDKFNFFYPKDKVKSDSERI